MSNSNKSYNSVWNQQFGAAPSYASVVSLRNIPLCPITRAAFGACARASSNAVFHSNKSSDVSACVKNSRCFYLPFEGALKGTKLAFAQLGLVSQMKKKKYIYIYIYLQDESTTITAIWK